MHNLVNIAKLIIIRIFKSSLTLILNRFAHVFCTKIIALIIQTIRTNHKFVRLNISQWKRHFQKKLIFRKIQLHFNILVKPHHAPFILCNPVFSNQPSKSQGPQHIRKPKMLINTFTILGVICVWTWTTWFQCTHKGHFTYFFRTNTTFSRWKAQNQN